jgi:hypothetical protein
VVLAPVIRSARLALKRTRNGAESRSGTCRLRRARRQLSPQWLLYSFRCRLRGNSSPDGVLAVSLFFFVMASALDFRWYRPDVSKSPILPLAAAVTALTLGALPAQAASLSPGKRDEVKVVAFPLLALRGQAPASVGSHVSHVSHSSHVSGIGGHNSHVSHVSHVSSVPAPPPTSAAPVTYQPPPPAAVTTSPAPAPATSTGGSPAVAPQGSPAGSPAVVGSGSSAVVGSGSPTSSTSNGRGCAFFLVAPFGALMSGIRRLVRRRKAR